MPSVDRHLFLIGFMGSGKSTVGRLVAERLGARFVDLDEEIVRREGRPIPRIFSEHGEQGFRAAESAVLAMLHDAPPAVVACGGGIVLDDANRTLLRELGDVAYLEVSAEEALARIGDTSGRPLLAGGGLPLAASLLRSRERLYQATADLVVPTAGRDPRDVAADIVAGLRGAA